MKEKLKVDIIGGGVSGLATAYYLNKNSDYFHIRVWEKDLQLGGLAGAFQFDDFRLEKFYHHVYKNDFSLQNLIKELNLWDDFIWKQSSTGLYYSSRPYRFSSPMDVLSFKPLNICERFDFVKFILRTRFFRDWNELDEYCAKEFVIKFAGEKIYHVIWEPLLRGKFGDFAENISAAWLWRKLIDRNCRNKKGIEELGYLKGSLSRVFESITKCLRASNHEVHLGTAVDKFEFDDQKKIVAIRVAEKRLETDLVICCNQVPHVLKLLTDDFSSYRQSLEQISFLANVCLVMILDEPLAQFYWNNIMDKNCPFVGVIEQTNWTGVEEYRNKHLVYISAYVNHDDKRLNMTSDELLDYYLSYLQKFFPKFKKSIVRKSFVWSAPFAQSVVRVGYRKLIPKIQSPIDNMLLCTMAHIFPHDRQVSNSVEMAKKVVKVVNNKFGLNHENS